MVFLKKHFKDRCPSKLGRKRDRAATEKTIIKAASELFAEKGYENTRTLEIAKAAGANEALITRYFGGKEGLLMAIMKDEESMQTILHNGKTQCGGHEAFPVKEEGKTLADGIRAFFARGQELAREREQFMRIASSRAFVDPEMAEVVRSRVVDHQVPPLLEAFKTYFDSKAAEKNIPKEEMQAAVMLISSSNFILNFMGRLVYKFDQKRIDLAMKILGEALELYFSEKNSSRK